MVEDEAERVRTIFRSYLTLGSLNLVMADLRHRGIVTKLRTLKTGRSVGGIPFTRGPLAYLLRNRFYIGEVVFRGEVFPGEQPALLDRDLFDAVQAKLNGQRNNHKAARAKSESPLIGRIYDDRGNRMSPSHARKQGIRYRYYVSSPLLQGQAGHAGSVRRVPAAEVEALVGKPSANIEEFGVPMENSFAPMSSASTCKREHLVIGLRASKQGQPLREGKTGRHRVAIAASWRPIALFSVCPGSRHPGVYPATVVAEIAFRGRRRCRARTLPRTGGGHASGARQSRRRHVGRRYNGARAIRGGA